MTNKLSFQFLSQPTDVNFGGKVHGGAVMKWLDQTAFACASHWASSYCVTVYVGGIRFYQPIKIGDVVRIDAQVIYTGNTSIHISLNVFSKTITEDVFKKSTHCIMVFVSMDENGIPQNVKKWIPETDEEKYLEGYALKLMDLRKIIESEMSPFVK